MGKSQSVTQSIHPELNSYSHSQELCKIWRSIQCHSKPPLDHTVCNMIHIRTEAPLLKSQFYAHV